MQVDAVPLQEPLQPAKVCPEDGVAVRVTVVPLVKASVQSVPQEIPVPVMVPFPETDVVRVYVVGVGVGVLPPPPPPPPPDAAVVLKAAETERFWERVLVQVGVEPPQRPPQRLKVLPVEGVARRVIRVLYGKTSAQTAVLHTLPFTETVPFPVRVTVRVRVPLAVAARGAVMVVRVLTVTGDVPDVVFMVFMDARVDA